jgi:hypothetical protein
VPRPSIWSSQFSQSSSTDIAPWRRHSSNITQRSPLYFSSNPHSITTDVKETSAPSITLLKDPRSLVGENDQHTLRQITQSRLAESTKKRREGKGIDRFTQFLQSRAGSDDYDITPYLHRISDGSMLDHSLRATLIALFAKWVEREFKEDPNIAISALKDDYESMGTDTLIFKSDILKEARKRIRDDDRDPREIMLERMAKEKQAISIDMISRAIDRYFPTTMFHCMLALTAGLFMLNWGQRPSNMAINTSRRAAASAANQRIAPDDTEREQKLEFLRDQLYKGHAIRVNEIFFWSGSQWIDAYEWNTNPTFVKVPSKMRILMLTSKTKKSGFPDQFTVCSDSSPGEYELIRMASDIAFHNRYDSKLDAFFSRPNNNASNSRINLQTADIGKLAKALARVDHLNENLFSAKS